MGGSKSSRGGPSTWTLLLPTAPAATTAASPTARDDVLRTQELVEVITSFVAPGDLLSWALGHEANLGAVRRRLARAAAEEGAHIVTPASDLMSDPDEGVARSRLRWRLAGAYAYVAEGRYCPADDLGDDAHGMACLDAIVEETMAAEPECDHQGNVRWDWMVWQAMMTAVAAAMKPRVGDAEVQRRGCGIFHKAARPFCYYMPDRGMDARELEAVVAAMRAHSDDLDLQREACGAIQELVPRRDLLTLRAAETGVIEAVVEAMWANVGDEELQSEACGALYFEDGNVFPFQARAVDAGGIEAVVAAMRAHDDSEYLLGRACLALSALMHVADADSNCGVDRFVCRAAEAGAIEAVVAAMQAYAGDELNYEACSVLCILAGGGSSVVDRMVRAGGIEALAAAMRTRDARGYSSVAVHMEACTALRHLLEDVDHTGEFVRAGAADTRARARQAGVAVAMTAANECHADDPFWVHMGNDAQRVLDLLA